jgi:hypothetical protein
VFNGIKHSQFLHQRQHCPKGFGNGFLLNRNRAHGFTQVLLIFAESDPKRRQTLVLIGAQCAPVSHRHHLLNLPMGISQIIGHARQMVESFLDEFEMCTQSRTP